MDLDRISRLVRNTLGFGALAALSILGVMNNSATRLHTWPWAFYIHIVLLVPFLLLGLRLISAPSPRIRGAKSTLALAGIIGLNVLLARHPAFSFEVALLLWSGLCWTVWVALEAADWFKPGSQITVSALPAFLRRAGPLLCLPLIAAVFWEVVELWTPLQSSHGIWEMIVLASRYRNPHPFGHWNYTGGYALLVLPWLAVLAALECGWRRGFYVVLLALGIVVLFWTLSRGAVLGLATMVVAAVMGYVFQKKLQRKQIVILLLTGITISGCLIASNARLRAMVFDPKTAFNPSEGDVQRLGMLQAGLLLIKHQPWLGYGPGMTPFVYPEVRAQVVGGVETSYQLHNTFLQLWVDHGLVGLFAGIMVGIFAFKGGWTYLRNPTAVPASLRALGLASLYSLAGYTVMAATDYQLNVPWITGAVGLHLGLLLCGTVQRDRPENIGQVCRATGYTLIAGAFGALIILIPDWRARHAFWEAWWATPASETARIAADLEEAADAAPGNPFYRTSFGLELATIAGHAADPKIAADAAKQAIHALEQSLVIDASQEPVHAALGWLYLNSNLKTAEAHFAAALKLIPDRDSLHLGLALARLLSGNHDGGVHALALECMVDPAFLAAPLWSQKEMSEARPEVIVELFRYYNRVLSDSRTPDWRKPALRFSAAWSHWWLNGTAPTAQELEGAEPAARAFFLSIAKAHETGSAIDPKYIPAPIQALIAAQQVPTEAEAILRHILPTPEAPAILAAVGRISPLYPGISDLLRSSPKDGEAIVLQPISRLHYNIMSRNLDGPGYQDLAPRQTYAFFYTFVRPLLPTKGIVPGPLLAALNQEP